MTGYTVSSLGGLVVATRLSTRGVDETIACVPADTTAAWQSVALRVLADAGFVATPEQADAFTRGFFGELSTQRYGVRTLRTSVVEDWIAAQQRGVAC